MKLFTKPTNVLFPTRGWIGGPREVSVVMQQTDTGRGLIGGVIVITLTLDCKPPAFGGDCFVLRSTLDPC
jgi:hypothetical protein